MASSFLVNGPIVLVFGM